MADSTSTKLYCNKCGRLLQNAQFYKKKDGTFMNICKKCVSMHIDVWNKESFLWILKDADVPYVPNEWNSIINKIVAEKGIENFSPAVCLGKYLASMRLSHYRSYHYDDTEMLAAEQRDAEQKEQEMRAEYEQKIKDDYAKGLISEAQYRTIVTANTQYEDYKNQPIAAPEQTFYNEKKFMQESDLPDVGAELTQDDRIYLATKWGTLYKPAEWVSLERHYEEMKNGYAITDPDSLSALVPLCKVYLKMNQALDCGDYDGAAKIERMYSSMRKTMNITAAQKKEEHGSDFDSIGQIVRFAESKKGGGRIARHKIDYPIDVIDETIVKLKEYYKTFIENDPGMAQQIEMYIKKRENAEMEFNNDKAGRDKELDDSALLELKESTTEQKYKDAVFIRSLGGKT